MTKVKDEFIKNKNNIGYVDSDFTKEFGNDEITSRSVLKAQTLQRDMTDSDILREFKIEECTLGDVLETLKSATPDMKDGYSNIFYIKGHPSRVVDVDWCAFDGGWDVYAWRRDYGSWNEGERVFSPATSGPESSSALGSETLALENAIKICKENGLKVTKEY